MQGRSAVTGPEGGRMQGRGRGGRGAGRTPDFGAVRDASARTARHVQKFARNFGNFAEEQIAIHTELAKLDSFGLVVAQLQRIEDKMDLVQDKMDRMDERLALMDHKVDHHGACMKNISAKAENSKIFHGNVPLELMFSVDLGAEGLELNEPIQGFPRVADEIDSMEESECIRILKSLGTPPLPAMEVGDLRSLLARAIGLPSVKWGRL